MIVINDIPQFAYIAQEYIYYIIRAL